MQANKSKMKRVKMGYLTIGQKVHPVYEGLNTIGRDKEATVIIRDLGVSHQHAILTIVRDGGHFISDFRSSNGTTLDRRKLGPLELHEIKGGSVITFSNNVQATYFKISDSNSSLLDTNSTLQNTQVDDTFYSANTQLLSDNDVTNVPPQNATTSIDVIPDDDLDFSNINTQFVEEVVVEATAIHDMPTQVYHHAVDVHELATQVIVVQNKDADDDKTKCDEEPSTSTHNTTTQKIPQPDCKEDTSIHEAETQPFNPLPEADTQILEWRSNCEGAKEICTAETSMHEAATQIVAPREEICMQEAAGDSIHEMATQIVSNVEDATRGDTLSEEATQLVNWEDDANTQIQEMHLNPAGNSGTIQNSEDMNAGVIEEEGMMENPSSNIEEMNSKREGDNHNKNNTKVTNNAESSNEDSITNIDRPENLDSIDVKDSITNKTVGSNSEDNTVSENSTQLQTIMEEASSSTKRSNSEDRGSIKDINQKNFGRPNSNSRESLNSVDSDPQSQLHRNQLQRRTNRRLRSDEDQSSIDSDKQSQLHTSQLKRRTLQRISSDDSLDSDRQSQLHTSQIKRSLRAIESDEESQSRTTIEVVNKEESLQRSDKEEDNCNSELKEDSNPKGGREEQNHHHNEEMSRVADNTMEEGSNDSIDFLNFASQMVVANSGSNSVSGQAGQSKQSEFEEAVGVYKVEAANNDKIAIDIETDKEESRDTDLDESLPQKISEAEETLVEKQAEEVDTDVDDSKSQQDVAETSKNHQDLEESSKSDQNVDQDVDDSLINKEGIESNEAGPKGDASSENDEIGTSRNRGELIRRSKRCKAAKTKENRSKTKEESESDSDEITKTRRSKLSLVKKPVPLIEDSTSDSDTDIEGNLIYNVAANKSSDFESSVVKRRSFLDVTDDIIPCTQEARALNVSDDVIPATQEVKKPSSSEESFKLGLTQFMENSTPEESQNLEDDKKLYVIKELQDDVEDDLIARSQRAMDKLHEITEELNNAVSKSGGTNQLQIATRGLIEAAKGLNNGMTSSRLERTISQDQLNEATHRLQAASDKMQGEAECEANLFSSGEEEEVFDVSTQKISRDSVKIEQESSVFEGATQNIDPNKDDQVKEDFSKNTYRDTNKEEVRDKEENTDEECDKKMNDIDEEATQVEDLDATQIEDFNAGDTSSFIGATQQYNLPETEGTTQTDPNIFLVATQKAMEKEATQTETGIFEVATQKAMEKEATQTETGIFEVATQKADTKLQDENIFFAATQKVHSQSIAEDEDTDVEDEVRDSSIFLLATQKADVTHDDGDTDEVKATDSSIFLLATQKADVSHDGTLKAEDVADSSIFLQATQKADGGAVDENIKKPIELASKTSSDEDDIFELATQQIPKPSLLLPPKIEKKSNVRDDEDVALQPNEMAAQQLAKHSKPNPLVPKLERKSNVGDEVKANTQDAIFEVATQNFSRQTSPDGAFLVPGKKLDTQDAIFEVATQKIAEDSASSRKNFRKHISFETNAKKAKVDEGSISLKSNKAEITNKEEKTISSTQITRKDEEGDGKKKVEETTKKDLQVESQLEVLFATQTLHLIEENSDRPKNPLASSLSATCTQDIVNRLSLIHGDETSSKNLDTQDVLDVLSSNEEARSKRQEEAIHSTQDVIRTLSSNKEEEQNQISGGSSKLSSKSTDKFNHPTRITDKSNFRKLSLSTVKPSTRKEEEVLISPTSDEDELLTTSGQSLLNEESLSRSKRNVKPLKSSTSEEEASFVKPSTNAEQNKEALGRSKRIVKPTSEEEGFGKPTTSTTTNEETLGRRKRNVKPLKSSTSEEETSFVKEESFASTNIKLVDNEANRRLANASIVTRKKVIILTSDDEKEDIVITVPKNQISLKIKDAKEDKQQPEVELKVPARRGRKKKSPEPEAHLESKRRKTGKIEESTKIEDAKPAGSEEKVARRRGRPPLDKNVGQEGSTPQIKARRGRKAATKDSQNSEENDAKILESKKAIGEEIVKPQRQSVEEDFEDKEEMGTRRSRLQNLESAVSEVRSRRGRKASVKETETSESREEQDKEEAPQVVVSRSQRGRKAANKESELLPQVSGSKLQRSKRLIVMEEAAKEEEMETGSKRGRKAASKEIIEDTPMLAKRSRKFEDDDSIASSSASSVSVLSTPKRRGAASLLGSPSLSTPERAKRKLKPKIVFTMLDSPELCTVIRSLGGMIVDSLEASTVLVTKSVLRTQKLLCAVGMGKPICSPEWLYACKKANTFLDPWDHLIQDPEAEKKWSFSLQESFDRSRNEKLFAEYSFQLIVNNAVDVLKGAIESCGGKCVSRSPKSGHFVVIASQENKAKCSKFFKQNVQVVLPEAIFDGVLRQEIVFNKHLLTL